MKSRSKNLILGAIFICAVFLAGVLADKLKFFSADRDCDESEFPYINYNLVCDGDFVIDKRSYVDSKDKIESFINQQIADGEISAAAVYFRDLQSGPTMGINEYEKFIPASLLKLPLLITYLQLEEKNPGFLEKKLRYYKAENFTPSIIQLVPPSETIQPNEPYLISELLKYMIAYSDNNAYNVLLKYLRQTFPEKNLEKETLNDLGIIESQGAADEVITVKSYASIFTQLYHSSFFNRKETSEMALELLVQSEFSQGLEAGIPPGIKVAHKFGEREFSDSNLRQLHDCGIIYYPQNPYLLCVMTRGNDGEKLKEIIQEISKEIYQEVNSRRLNK